MCTRRFRISLDCFFFVWHVYEQYSLSMMVPAFGATVVAMAATYRGGTVAGTGEKLLLVQGHFSARDGVWWHATATLCHCLPSSTNDLTTFLFWLPKKMAST
jgi:hypothetical protein